MLRNSWMKYNWQMKNRKNNKNKKDFIFAMYNKQKRQLKGKCNNFHSITSMKK